jgi:hypothetical protein
MNLFHKKRDQPQFYVICKIIDWELFDEYFPLINNRRVQPSWEFFEQKGVIKIELDHTIIDETISYSEFLNNSDLDIPFFETFSKIFIYVEYRSEQSEFINVYQENTYIDVFDFKFHQTKSYKRYRNILHAIVKNNENLFLEPEELNITDHFKKFLNNMYPVTLEMVLLFIGMDFNLKGKVLTVQSESTIKVRELI